MAKMLLSVPDERALLRGKAGRQVLLRVKSTAGQIRDVIATPISAQEERNLRYKEWEYSRRLKVEADSQGHIGYVHLRAMGSERHRAVGARVLSGLRPPGLIIDVRHNGGGNIDSWLLG